MKAMVRDVYGGPEVLRWEERPVPEPGPGEVLVRVRASSLNRADYYFLTGTPMPLRAVSGLFRPKREGLGKDFAGDVVALGEGVSGVEVGEAVYGETELLGTLAEYAVVGAHELARMPEGLTYGQAASLPLAGATALEGMRDYGRVGPGQEVLINGATGSVGHLAVQVAVALGARVTAVCSERNDALVRALGAHEVIHYEREDFTRQDRRFDVLYDVVSSRPLAACRRVMRPGATYLPVGGPSGRWLGPLVPLLGVMMRAPFISQRVASFTSRATPSVLEGLTELVERGALMPHITRTFGLDETADAFVALQTQRPPTKLVVTM